MKNAIVQFNINPDLYCNESKKTSLKKTNSSIFDYSQKSFKNYCEKFNLDHIIITEPKINYEHPTWERLDLWFDKTWFEKYENICYVDTDVFAMPWAENIFNYSDTFSFCRIPYWKADLMLKKYELFFNCNHDRVRECWFQTGVILLNKNIINNTLDIMKRFKDKEFSDDGVLLNYAIINSKLQIKNIPKHFNVKYAENLNLEEIQFLHAFGRLKDVDPESIVKLLRTLYD